LVKLIRCELWKLKRKKLALLVIISAFLFPIPLTVLITSPRITDPGTPKTEVFQDLFRFVMGNGVQFLLPCVIGVLAALLFFMERDSDAFKSLRTIPVTSTQMVLAKVSMLFLFGILFSVTSMVATVLCGGMVAEVNKLAYMALVSVEMGIFITAGTLPLVALVVFFSKTYIFSVLMCIFYSVLSLTLEALFGVMPALVCHLAPIPLVTLWCAGDMIRHGFNMNLKELEPVIPSTPRTAFILSVMAVLSVLLIDWLYKRRGE